MSYKKRVHINLSAEEAFEVSEILHDKACDNPKLLSSYLQAKQGYAEALAKLEEVKARMGNEKRFKSLCS